MAKKTTTAEQLDRLYQLCGVLQHYRESVTRLEDAKKQDDARQHLLHVRQAGRIVGGSSAAKQDELDAAHTQNMVRRLDAALDNWTPLVNEFFRLAILNRLEIMSPACGQIESKQRMPHRIDSFDWQAFDDELRSVRHAVIKRQMSSEANGTPTWDKPTEARNKWLYEQCHKGTKYEAILAVLKTKSPKWQGIVSVNGIKKAANTYATRKQLKPIPRRGAGRPKQK